MPKSRNVVAVAVDQAYFKHGLVLQPWKRQLSKHVYGSWKLSVRSFVT